MNVRFFDEQSQPEAIAVADMLHIPHANDCCYLMQEMYTVKSVVFYPHEDKADIYLRKEIDHQSSPIGFNVRTY